YLTGPFIGSPGIYIAVGALAVGHGPGMGIAAMQEGLQDESAQVRLLLVVGPRGSKLRGDTHHRSTPAGGAAPNLLKELPAQRGIAVLGEMREMGIETESGHRIIGGRAGEICDMLVTFGALTDISIAAAKESAAILGRKLTVVRFGSNQREELTG